jgi:hypothetical protein
MVFNMGFIKRNVRRRGLNAAWWQSLARDAAWRAQYPAFESPLAATWALPCDLPGDIHVRWPEKYRWDDTWRWVETIRQGLASKVPVSVENVPQRHHGHVIFEIVFGDRTVEGVIDWRDTHDIVEEVAEVSPVLFKMQYRENGYGRENVVPGGFTPGNPKLYRYLSALRQRRDTTPLEGVYARFSPNADVRVKAIDSLRRQDRFRYVSGGLQPYTTYLHEIAGAAVCIDLPGRGDLCFRLVDCLAIGACIVRPKGETRLHVPLVAEENVAYCRDDVSDLVDVCAELLTDEPRRARIANGAREYFDKYLAREQLAAYYLATTAKHAAGILTLDSDVPHFVLKNAFE